MCTRPRFIAAATALLLAAGSAACTAESPTASSTAPVGPRLEGGSAFGSGNVVAGDPNVHDRNAAADSGSMAAPYAGPGVGSGN
jgi:hypothetical protein